MVIHQAKLIKRYATLKKDPFDIKQRCLGDSKLNKQFVLWGIEKQVIHGRNLFLFNPYFSSLSTMDHLFLTPNGIYLIDVIDSVEGVKPYDEKWWFRPKTNQLIPNQTYLLKRKAEQLMIYLRLQTSIQVPVHSVIVSKKGTLTDVFNSQNVLSQLNTLPTTTHLTQEQQQTIQKLLLKTHRSSVETKQAYYEPTFWLNHYCPFGSFEKTSPEHRLYQQMNHFFYENLPEAVIFHRYRLPVGGIQLPFMDYLVVSKKGFLIINQLLEGDVIKAGDCEEVWIREQFATKKTPASTTSISNLILQSHQQGEQLMTYLPVETPISYSVFAMDTIDVKIKHSALSMVFNLEHNLDRYIKQREDVLTQTRIYQLLHFLKGSQVKK